MRSVTLTLMGPSVAPSLVFQHHILALLDALLCRRGGVQPQFVLGIDIVQGMGVFCVLANVCTG